MRQGVRRELAAWLATLCLAGLAAPAVDSPESKVPVEPISYENLGKLVRSYRGKVVLVSFWAQY